MEGVDSLPERLDGRGRRLEQHRSPAEGRVAVRPDRHAQDHAVVAGPAAAERPVQVGVPAGRRREQPAVGRHHLPLQHVVRREPVAARQRRVAAPLGVAPRRPDRRALAAHDDLPRAPRGRHDVEPLNAGAKLDGLALVKGVVPVLEGDLLEVVRPDRQRARARASAQVVVPRVADDEADVVGLGKVHGRHDVGGRAHVDDIANVVAQATGAGPRRKGVTTLVGEER